MPDSTRDLQRYLDRPLTDLMDEFNLHAEATYGTIKGLNTAWDKLVPTLKQKICVEGNWCQRRQDARFDDPLNVALALAALIDDPTIRVVAPASLIAVILVKRGVDAFCGCAPLGAQQAD